MSPCRHVRQVLNLLLSRLPHCENSRKDVPSFIFILKNFLIHRLHKYWHTLFSFQLESGGDMPFQKDFSTQAVRFGLVLKQVCKQIKK